MNFEDGSLNPYAILGLPFGADFDLVKAIYKSMVKIYHPDTFVGDKKFAAQRLIELNAAFEFLSDPKKKKAYDTSINSKEAEEDTDFTETDNSFDDETSSLMESWEFACEYHPEIPGFYNDLKKLNKRSAFAFMAILVEQKLYADAKKIANYLETKFLTSAFGDDEAVRAIGKAALLANEKQYALELNHTLKKLGYSSVEQILTKLLLKYPDFGFDVLFKSKKYRFLIVKAGVYKGPQTDRPPKPKDGPWGKKGNPPSSTWVKTFLKVSLIFIFSFFLAGSVAGIIRALAGIVGATFHIAFLAEILIIPLSILFTYLINKKLGGKNPVGHWKKIDFLIVPVIFVFCSFFSIIAAIAIGEAFGIGIYALSSSFWIPLSVLFTYLIHKKFRNRGKKP